MCQVKLCGVYHGCNVRHVDEFGVDGGMRFGCGFAVVVGGEAIDEELGWRCGG